MTARDIITTATRELGVIDGIEAPPADLAMLCLNSINGILDGWNADRGAVYADVFAEFPLTPSLQPHTIGPSGSTWNLPRPITIDGAQISTDGGTTWSPINLDHGAGWFASLSSPDQTSDIPTDGFYNGNGELYLWPVPISANKVKLWTRAVLANLTLDAVVDFPAGYVNALTKTLKEQLTQMPMFAGMASDKIERAAARARSAIFANNTQAIRLVTAGSGLPGGSGGYFDYRTGRVF